MALAGLTEYKQLVSFDGSGIYQDLKVHTTSTTVNKSKSSQCLTLFFVTALILSSHLLIAILHAMFLMSIPLFVSILFLFSISFLANSVYFSSDSSLNVSG